MDQLIGKINYPATSEELGVEYFMLYSKGEDNLLVFRLINRSEKTVNAYRVDVCYIENGVISKHSVEDRNIELGEGKSGEKREVLIPRSIEEGEIIISAVVYDDLSHNESPATFPFASFETVSRVADTILSGEKPKRSDIIISEEKPKRADTTISEEKPKKTASSRSNVSSSAEMKDAESYNCEEPKEIEVEKRSPLPLIFALLAVGSEILAFIIGQALGGIY